MGFEGLKTAGLVTEGQFPVGEGYLQRPRLRFRTRPLHQCPFLINDLGPDGILRGKCSLHPHHKPLACTLSPLTRTLETLGGEKKEVWAAIAPVEGCPGMGRGPELKIQAPARLRGRLDREARWMEDQIGLKFAETAGSET